MPSIAFLSKLKSLLTPLASQVFWLQGRNSHGSHLFNKTIMEAKGTQAHMGTERDLAACFPIEPRCSACAFVEPSLGAVFVEGELL